MLERLGRSAAALALALMASWTGTARAEPGLLLRLPGGGYTCGALPTPTDCTVDAPCATAGGPGTCRMLFGQRFCIPDNSFGICCDSPSDCPVVTGATAACVSSSVADALVCVESGRSYCGADTLLDPTLTQRCHKGAGGVPVRWILGDCDGDGVTNGDELTDGTDECIGPQPRGIWDGSTCLPQRTGCALTSSCGATDSGPSGTCEIADDDNGHRCVPAEEVLYCADGALECAPELIEVSDSSGMGSGHVWCIPADCAGVEDVDLLDCVTKEGAPSLFSEGDCDRDGTRNGDDPSPCVADAPPPDAGPPTDDAGVPAIDAGNGSFDAGPGGGPEPSFEGGGGCACRAATGSGSGPAGAIVALLALGAVLLRRKRC